MTTVTGITPRDGASSSPVTRWTVMRHLFAVLASALVLPAAAAQAAPVSLPAVKRSVSASGTTQASCYQGLRSGSGIATTSYGAPMAGFVDVRSSAVKGDWDLALYD